MLPQYLFRWFKVRIRRRWARVGIGPVRTHITDITRVCVWLCENDGFRANMTWQILHIVCLCYCTDNIIIIIIMTSSFLVSTLGSCYGFLFPKLSNWSFPGARFVIRIAFSTVVETGKYNNDGRQKPKKNISMQ